jgi:hypothetical protein
VSIPELGTQNFRDFKPDLMGTAVRISNSGPRFKTRYDKKNMEKIPQLYPDKDIFRKGLSPEDFRTRYRAQLYRVGIKEINYMIEQISRRNPGPLVFLCFEKVLDGEYCHRRVFAEWYFEQTGALIPELAVDVNNAAIWHFEHDILNETVTEGMAIPHHNRGIVGPIKQPQENLL